MVPAARSALATPPSARKNGVETPSSSPVQKLITSTTKLIPTFKSPLNPHINPEREEIPTSRTSRSLLLYSCGSWLAGRPETNSRSCSDISTLRSFDKRDSYYFLYNAQRSPIIQEGACPKIVCVKNNKWEKMPYREHRDCPEESSAVLDQKNTSSLK